jgi:hypothetical protein
VNCKTAFAISNKDERESGKRSILAVHTPSNALTCSQAKLEDGWAASKWRLSGRPLNNCGVSKLMDSNVMLYKLNTNAAQFGSIACNKQTTVNHLMNHKIIYFFSVLSPSNLHQSFPPF